MTTSFPTVASGAVGGQEIDQSAELDACELLTHPVESLEVSGSKILQILWAY